MYQKSHSQDRPSGSGAMLAAALLFYGTGLPLSSSERMDLLYNTLASVFVFEVDEMLYNGLIPPLFTFWVEKSSTINVDEDEETVAQEFAFYINLVLLTSATGYTHYNWCTLV